MFHQGISFAYLENLHKNPYEIPSNLIHLGKIIIDINEKDISFACNNATLTNFDSKYSGIYKVYLTQTTPKIRSKVGNILANRRECDFSAIFHYDYKSNEWWISLRAKTTLNENGHDIGHDLSQITSKLPKGGGHPKAAGFTINNNIHGLGYYFTQILPDLH